MKRLLPLLCVLSLFGCSMGTSPSACEKEENQNVRDLCYAEVAMEAKDPTYCATIVSSENKDICYRNVGILTNDISLCGEIEDKNQRYFCQAPIRKDSSLCELITNQLYAEQCRGEVAKAKKTGAG